MNKALLVIGLQSNYSNIKEFDINKSNYALQAISQVIDYFRSIKFPIFHIQNQVSKNGSSLVENIPELLPLENESVIISKDNNSFYETDLYEKLQDLNIDNLVICGLFTDLAIDTTVRYAKNLGYKITLISDACVSRNLEFNSIKFPSVLVNNVIFASLLNEYAEIFSSKEYIKNSNNIEDKNKDFEINLLDIDIDKEISTIENGDVITAEDLKDLESADEEYLIYEYDK